MDANGISTTAAQIKVYDLFENKPCSRCDGSGQHSWNQRDGSKCFGCRGFGFKFTKLGQARYDFWFASMSKSATELLPGDKIKDPYSKQWYTVVSVTLHENGTCDISTTTMGWKGHKADTMWRVAQSNEDKLAKALAAAEYVPA